MKIPLQYGRHGLTIETPDSAVVLRAGFTPALADPEQAVSSALKQPITSPALRDRVKPGQSVIIAHSDMTRATPNRRILPVLLKELEEAGIRRQDITLINALGTHRPQTPAELRTLLGDEIVNKYRCIQHDPEDDATLVSLGQTSYGHPVRLNRHLLEADFKVLTGFIEPHLFAGFSGGPKCILPGLAGSESVVTNHGVEMIGHPNASWGITSGNPLWEEMLDMALRVQPTFLLNVTMNSSKQITGVFAGDLVRAHQAGCDFARSHSMVAVQEPFDIVITTNSGYPLDQNLYQSAKGMKAAASIVRDGGAILLATACEEGMPDNGHYDRLLSQVGSIDDIWKLLKTPGFSAGDQWMLQIQAMIQERADVYVYSDGLSDTQIRKALMIPCRDLPETLDLLVKKHGGRICVLPEGPLTIAYIQS